MIKKTYEKDQMESIRLRTGLAFVLVFLLVAYGCATPTPEQIVFQGVVHALDLLVKRSKPTVPDQVEWERPRPCGDWIRQPPAKSDQYIYFVGLSDYCSTEKEARSDALAHGILQVAQYAGVNVVDVSNYYLSYIGKTSANYDPYISKNQYTKLLAQAFVSHVEVDKWCIQRIRREGDPWKAFALVKVPPSEIERIRTYKAQKRLYGAKPKLSYVIRSGEVSLLWGGPAGGGLTVKVYKLCKESHEWKAVSPPIETGTKEFPLRGFEWGDTFKITISDGLGNHVDSNQVTVKRKPSIKSDFFYSISSESYVECERFKRVVEDFEIALIRVVKKAGKTCQSVEAQGAEHILRFLVRQDESSRGFHFSVFDQETGKIFFRSHYMYSFFGHCRGIVGVDRSWLERNLQSLIHGLCSEKSRDRSPNRPRMAKPRNLPFTFFVAKCEGPVSLVEAQRLCENEGGRLMTYNEWIRYSPHFRNKRKEGEYVKEGRIYLDTGKNQWLFERVFQPEASNYYCVRCIKHK